TSPASKQITKGGIEIEFMSSLESKTSWSLWRRQIVAVMRLELKKNFFGKRSVLVYLLALMPVFLLTCLALLMPATSTFTNLPRIFAWIYGGLILRTVVFFGCAWIFMY